MSKITPETVSLDIYNLAMNLSDSAGKANQRIEPEVNAQLALAQGDVRQGNYAEALSHLSAFGEGWAKARKQVTFRIGDVDDLYDNAKRNLETLIKSSVALETVPG